MIEIMKPLIAEAAPGELYQHPHLDSQPVVELIEKKLKNKIGDELENAAAEMMLTACPGCSASGCIQSDWMQFVAWVARRTQPLEGRLLHDFAVFYARRLEACFEAAQDEIKERGLTRH